MTTAIKSSNKPTDTNNNNSDTTYFEQLVSLYDSIEHRPPLLRPGRLSFFLPKLLAKADKTIEEGRKHLSKIETAKASSINNAKLIPENATIRREYIKCGRSGCHHERHGPYYYAYWKDSESNKLKKKYIGRYFEENKEVVDSERSTRTQSRFT